MSSCPRPPTGGRACARRCRSGLESDPSHHICAYVHRCRCGPGPDPRHPARPHTGARALCASLSSNMACDTLTHIGATLRKSRMDISVGALPARAQPGALHRHKHGRVVARQARQRGQRVRAHGLAGAARRGRQQRARERRFRKTARPRGRLRGDVADRVADVPLRAPRARLRTYPGAASRRVGVARSRAERSPCGAAEPRTRAHVTQPRSAGRTDTLPKPLPMLGFPPSVRPAAHAQG